MYTQNPDGNTSHSKNTSYCSNWLNGNILSHVLFKNSKNYKFCFSLEIPPYVTNQLLVIGGSKLSKKTWVKNQSR